MKYLLNCVKKYAMMMNPQAVDRKTTQSFSALPNASLTVLLFNAYYFLGSSKQQHMTNHDKWISFKVLSWTPRTDCCYNWNWIFAVVGTEW